MTILTHVSIPDAFVIFFLTLGPLKLIGPFARITQSAEPALLRRLAWRSALIATVIVMALALLGAILLRQWRVSVAALTVTGGIILFLQAFRMIMEPPAAPLAATPPAADQAPPSMAMAQFPLAIPALVTAPGIVAIAAFMAIAHTDLAQISRVLALLLVIMTLDLLAMLHVRLILKYISQTILLVLGWIIAVLQAALAIQYIFNALVRLGVLTPVVS